MSLKVPIIKKAPAKSSPNQKETSIAIHAYIPNHNKNSTRPIPDDEANEYKQGW